MTLIFSRDVIDGGTHALVFGVGCFAFLNGTNQGLPQDLRQVEPVTSPPNSAVAFVEWLIETQDDLIPPLASIELLISPTDGSTGTFNWPCASDDPRSNSTVDRATGAYFAGAAREWLQRSEAHESNLAILYGSSHGFQGQEHVLLFEDAGEDPMEPWRNMLSIDHVRRNLFTKMNKRSIILAECCRNLLDSASTSLDAISGRQIGNVTAREYARSHQERARAVYSLRAAPFGKEAEATKNGLGYFTEALLHCLRGGTGTNDPDEGWSIDPSGLRQAVKEAGLYGLNHDVDPRDEESHWVGPPFVRLKRTPEYPVRVQDAEASNNEFVDLVLENLGTSFLKERPAAPGAEPLNAWVPPTFEQYCASGFSQLTNTALNNKSFMILGGGADIRLESREGTE